MNVMKFTLNSIIPFGIFSYICAMGKAVLTSEYILKKVAPYFNLHGYHGTSMSDITSLTGLTKGAIYGNFESKEHLALEAFRYNIKILLGNIGVAIAQKESSYEKLLAILEFYRNYIDYSQQFGGCPILKVGMDSLNNNSLLNRKVKSITKKLKKSIEDIIVEGQCQEEIEPTVDAKKMSDVIYGTIQGGIFLATLLDSKQALNHNIDHAKIIIEGIKI